MKRPAALLPVLFLAFLVLAPSDLRHASDISAIEPPALYLTWQQDATSSMTIDWHTLSADASPLLYAAPESGEWIEWRASSHPFPHSDRTIHRVELTGLEPGATYRFRIEGFTREYWFRTLPKRADRPVRFAAGGDVATGSAFRRTNRAAMRYDPDFIVWGGDLAYANGDPERIHLWYEWFDDIRQTLIHEDGRVVPILVAIGNHELFGTRRMIRAGLAETDEEAERIAVERWGWSYADDHPTFFFDLFAAPGRPGYSVVDAGDYMSILLLDSDHYASVEGEQTEWLRKALSERSGVPHLFPVYHVPAYPSVRSFDGETSRRIRDNWVPLFETHGVRMVFENHDHAYKRTKPLLGGQPDRSGVVYIGDGAWGVTPREIGSRTEDGETALPGYLACAHSDRHFILTTIQGPHQHILVVNEHGTIIDEYPETLRPWPGSPARTACPDHSMSD